jgi:hypothetical protein
VVVAFVKLVVGAVVPVAIAFLFFLFLFLLLAGVKLGEVVGVALERTFEATFKESYNVRNEVKIDKDIETNDTDNSS